MSTPKMSTPTEISKRWEGTVVEGKFPLRQWLGGSNHSAVFLTERGQEPRRAVVKLIPSAGLDEDAQLARWAGAAKLSHPNVLRLFEYGRVQIDNTRLLYVVMEYAEEDLAQVLPLRPLSASEASEMLSPTVEALASLLRQGFVHGRIQPSNIMAVDNQLKISTDSLRRLGERAAVRTSAYDAPEVGTVGLSPASDVWSLGATLIAVLTQAEPKLNRGDAKPVAVPEHIPQPLYDILRQCLQVDPQKRCTLSEILGQSHLPEVVASRPPVATPKRDARPKRWIVAPIIVVALFVIVLVAGKIVKHPPPTPAGEARSGTVPNIANSLPAQSAAPLAQTQNPGLTESGVKPGSVLQSVSPEVSRNALNTVTGRVKVGVQVGVDTSGNVTDAKLIAAGPSKYFANRALAAARGWKFNPAQVDGQPAPSEWILRFQFTKASAQVFPAETKP